MTSCGQQLTTWEELHPIYSQQGGGIITGTIYPVSAPKQVGLEPQHMHGVETRQHGGSDVMLTLFVYPVTK